MAVTARPAMATVSSRMVNRSRCIAISWNEQLSHNKICYAKSSHGVLRTGLCQPCGGDQGPARKLLYTIAIYTGTGIQKPDYLATVDVDPDSPTYSQVIHRLEMPGIGDELHHMGWNACSSCHDDAGMSRKYLLLPGVRSNNIHVVDTATDPRAPRLHKVIDGAEIKSKTDLFPHTVHCLGSEIIISFLGDAKGEAPGGYLHLEQGFRDRRPLGKLDGRHQVRL